MRTITHVLEYRGPAGWTQIGGPGSRDNALDHLTVLAVADPATFGPHGDGALRVRAVDDDRRYVLESAVGGGHPMWTAITWPHPDPARLHEALLRQAHQQPHWYEPTGTRRLRVRALSADGAR